MWSAIAIAPSCGCSSPAIARSSVVLPLPEGPSRATTWPGVTLSETPLRISLSPRRRRRSLTTRSAMQAHSEPDRGGEADADHHHIDDGKGGHQIDRAGAPQRHQQRADHFGARPEQIDAGGTVSYTHLTLPTNREV